MKASSFPNRAATPDSAVTSDSSAIRLVKCTGQQAVLQADVTLGSRTDDVDRVAVVFLEELDRDLIRCRPQVGEAGDVNALGLQAGQDRAGAVGRGHHQRLAAADLAM